MPAPRLRTFPAPGSPTSRLRSRTGFAWGLALLVLAPVACDPGFPGPGEGETISEEAFVETMVELRRAAAHWEMRRLPVEERDSILAIRSRTPEDLLEFVEVHGTDVPYMNRVWTRVEARLTGRDVESLQDDAPEAEDLVEEGILPRDAVPDLPAPEPGSGPGIPPDPGPEE
ncbi:MAG: hypothetical protein EA421_12260 [Gemmatimonadales bacterium]|nr:MAG: hypothetical protein EA421_12260 [Gemmatimonadales bacterium]